MYQVFVTGCRMPVCGVMTEGLGFVATFPVCHGVTRAQIEKAKIGALARYDLYGSCKGMLIYLLILSLSIYTRENTAC